MILLCRIYRYSHFLLVGADSAEEFPFFLNDVFKLMVAKVVIHNNHLVGWDG